MFLERKVPAAAEYRYRAAERVSAKLQGILVDASGAEQPARLRDISNFGLMAECEDYLPIGSIVTLRLAGLEPIKAEIRWALAGWIGCRFDRELDAETLISLANGPGNPTLAE